ncbi:MAG: type II secretion system protein GspD [Rehaibacterium terrae]|uniref:type II secretion system protein GspD n=1 Tax=Rehaibacterium terrae TaxID=1341696 RepID=UPI00391D6664
MNRDPKDTMTRIRIPGHRAPSAAAPGLRRTLGRLGAVLALAVWLAGCATVAGPAFPEPLRAPKEAGEAEQVIAEAEVRHGRPRVEPGPTVAARPYRSADRQPAPRVPAGAPIALTLDAVNLTAFINEVFGTQLGYSLEIDQAVRQREDLISLRLVEPEPPQRVYAIAVEVLKRYGVRVQEEQGLLRFTLGAPDEAEPPLVLTGRTLPDVPASQRPVFVVMPLNVAEPSRISGQVRTLFGAQPGLQFSEMVENNALLISGPPAVVQSAMEAVRMLDRVSLRDKLSLRINPLYVGAAQLARELREVLVGQGYSVRLGAGTGGAVTLVPVASANALLLFSESEEALSAAADWAERLDQPSDAGAGDGGVYLYAARHTNAESLKPVLEAMVEGAEGNKLVVDPLRNTIVFQGEAQRWRALQGVLARLDQPARQVVIEVTVAEVTLTGDFRHGVEWALRNAGIGGFKGPLNIFQGSGAEAGGVVWSPISGSGSVRAVLNALSENSRVSILSTPRLMVRSGESASIDVGTEVPIITSQATAPDLPQTGSSILQQIQYRKTGVLLEIEAIVHSGQRVDLTVSQEVSEARATTTSDISSPSIFSRRVKTSLSLSDGDAMLLGGLISSTSSRATTEVPGVARIPVLGKLFQNNVEESARTELLVLITPYVVEDAAQAREITEALRGRFGAGAE